MKVLGLDIGTTTISSVIRDDEKGVLASETVANDASLKGDSMERLQDPRRIYETALGSVKALLSGHPDTVAIGVTGQMHGILYLDASGEPQSPLYTWQDGRGDLLFDDTISYAAYLSALTGYELSSGYGLVTHYYNLAHAMVPRDAVKLCTIPGYVAMRLAGLKIPRSGITDAASLGLFNVMESRFDTEALTRAGIDPDILPGLADGPLLGSGALGLPVYAPLGDNQASFLGAAGAAEDTMLINVGTGAQISIYTPRYLKTDTLETRPFPDGGFLLVGASLCGGRSYALLERFFRETVRMVTGAEVSAYEAMDRALDEAVNVSASPIAVTSFAGTRLRPEQKASFSGIDADNFTPVHFTYSVMRGIADELYAMYLGYLEKGGKKPKTLAGSGNGLKKNRHLCHIIEDTFDCPLTLSDNDEDAACGAAVYASVHCR